MSQSFLNAPEIVAHKVLKTKVLQVLSILGICLSLYCVFMVVPNDRILGAVQRIFYFHVASAFAAYLHLGILMFASSFFLLTSQEGWDMFAKAAGGVAFLFCTVVLSSGMIWGHSSWHTWWRWEPRLVSFLILWLTLLGYAVLRLFTEDNPRQRHFAAVLGILAAVQVPVVIFSIKLLDHSEQLHPQVASGQGLRDVRFVWTLVATSVSLIITSCWILFLRIEQFCLERLVLNLGKMKS